MSAPFISDEEYLELYKRNLIPLYVVLASLVWVLHDYLVTLEDEIVYIWRQRNNFSKNMFLWIRYYTIFLLIVDALQIHGFVIPGVISDALCVAVAPTTRVAGAIALWSVEIVMQVRIYVLFKQSKKIAFANGILFIISIGLFLWIMVQNAIHRSHVISKLVGLGLPGCPVKNGGSEWALWIPATVFELVLFVQALYKVVVSTTVRTKINNRPPLVAILISENVLYFFSIACLLIFNNLMVVGATRIPWFGYGPFHAALGIVTCRMLIHLRKYSVKILEGGDIPKLVTIVPLSLSPEQEELDENSHFDEITTDMSTRDLESGLA